MKVAVEEWELYNNGILLCKWFDLEDSNESDIEAFVKKSKKENNLNYNDLEIFCADVEDDILNLLKNDASISEAYNLQEIYSDIDESDIEAINMLLNNNLANDVNDAIDKKYNIVNTGCTNMEDVAYYYIEETGALKNMPESLQNYFDYESLGRDMEIEGTFITDDDGTIWEYRE